MRWSGGALLASGILQAVGTALHPDDAGATPYFQSVRWAPAHVALAVSFLLAIFGLIGLYVQQHDRVGRAGIVGFVLAVADSALLVGVTLAEATLLPIIAAGQPPKPLADWLDLGGSLAGAVVVSVCALVCYSCGFVLLGIVTTRAGVLPRWAGILLVAGTLLSNGEFFGPIGFASYVGGGILVGIAFAWLGYALWANPALKW